MPGWKRRDVGAQIHQCLHLGGHADSALHIMSQVQRTHAERIACDQVALRSPVPQRKREDTVEALHEVDAVPAVQCVDDFAIGRRREVLIADRARFGVTVDFAVDRERQCAVTRAQRLCAADRSTIARRSCTSIAPVSTKTPLQSGLR